MKANSFEETLLRDESFSLNYKAVNAGYKMDFHCHRGFEIFQFFTGSGTLLVEDQIYNLEPNSLYIINSLHLHRTMLDAGAPYLRTVLTIRPDCLVDKISPTETDELFTPFFQIKRAGRCKVPVTEEEFRRTEVLFSDIQHEITASKFKTDFIIALRVAEILTIIGRAYRERESSEDKSIKASPAYGNIQRVLEYLNAHISEDITMSKLEAAFNLSKYYLCHIFREKTGFSIFEYLLNRRIATAKKMLLESDHSITEIAEALKFSDTAHFSRSFKKSAGLPPGEYRRIGKNGLY